MDAEAERRPDPRSATTPAEFLHALRRLRAWSGQPSLRTLTRLAGTIEVPGRPPADALPVSTLSDNLNGKRLPNLPRHAFVTAFVTACLRAQGTPAPDIPAALTPWTETLQTLTAPEAPENTPDPAPDTPQGLTPDTLDGLEPDVPDGRVSDVPDGRVPDASGGLVPDVPDGPEVLDGRLPDVSGGFRLGGPDGLAVADAPDEVGRDDFASVLAEGSAGRTMVLVARESAVVASGKGRRLAFGGLRKTHKGRGKARPAPIVTALLGAVVGAAAVWALLPAHVNGGVRSDSQPGAAVSPSGGSPNRTVLPGAGHSGPSGNAPGRGDNTPGSGGGGPTNSGPSGNGAGKKGPAGNGPSTAGGDTQTANNPQPKPSWQIPSQPSSGAFDPRKQAGKYDPGKFKFPTAPSYP